ncbi:MAG: chromate transporter [Armatimonadetes bacterium]|nr:chromate transporter [Armatimonadota bacterium]
MRPRGWAIAFMLGMALVLGPRIWNPVLGHLNLVLMKLGIMAFGGGFTLIPLIQQEVVSRLGWLTTREFIDGVALGQVTPGPILITATFIGYKIGGLAGAATSTIAVFLPSFLVLVGVVPHFDELRRLQAVQTMIRGVLAAFIGLLLFILHQFGQAALTDWRTWAVAIVVFAGLRGGVGLLTLVGLTAVVSLLAL